MQEKNKEKKELFLNQAVQRVKVVSSETVY